MPKRRIWIYVLMFALATINYVDRVVLSVSATSIAREFSITPVELGYLFSSFLWLYLVCLVPMGVLVDRFGSRAVNAAGIGLWSAATAHTALATGLWGLLAARILMGVGESTTYPAAGRVIREWIPRGERGLFAAIFNAGAYFGPAVGGIVLAWLVEVAGWRVAFLVCAAAGFVWLAAWLVWYRRPEAAGWLDPRERDLILREREADAAAPAAAPSPVLRLLASPAMLGLMLTQGCAVYTQYLFLTWLPNYLQAERGMTMLKSGALMALPYVGAVVLTTLVGRLSDARLAKQGTALGARRSMAALSMLLGAVILLTPITTNVYLVLVLIMVALGGVASTVALNIALVGDLLRSSADAGRATSLLILGGNIFGILAPIVTGYVVQATGHFDAAFVVAGALLLLGAISVVTFARHPIGASADARGPAPADGGRAQGLPSAERP
jgi:MFS family permease